MPAQVASVALSPTHTFSKTPCASIQLVEALGVVGDAHYGVTVKHRSRLAVDPSQPNLRQVHLLHIELFDLLKRRGFDVGPEQLGENILISGLDLLALPQGTDLRIGPAAAIKLTGLRNPCAQLDAFKPGLLSAVLDRGPRGELVRLAGVMGIVVAGGQIAPGMPVSAVLPGLPHRPLERV